MTSSPSGRAWRVLTAVVAVVLLVGACSDDDGGGVDGGGASRGSSTTASTSSAPPSTEPGTEPTPRATLREAVEALLTAEQDGDSASSFRLLGSDARLTYRTDGEWADRRSELPPVTGFEIETADRPDTVVAVVTHEPGLDPFIGLSPARERQTWKGVEEDGGWVVAGEPEVEFLLPEVEGAIDAVTAWTAAVQACDETAAAELEAVGQIFGLSVGADELCGSTGEVALGEPTLLDSGPQSADLVAQYSTDVFDWARVVPVTAPTSPFFVVVAPIGEVWEIVAVYD